MIDVQVPENGEEVSTENVRTVSVSIDGTAIGIGLDGSRSRLASTVEGFFF